MRLIFLITCFSFFASCNQKDWREEVQPIDWKILHKDTLASKRKDFVLIGGDFSSKDELLTKWFESIQKNPNSGSYEYVLTDEEYKNFFLPHTIGLGTALDTTPLETYWPMFLHRKEMGLQKIKDTISHSNGTIQKIYWRDSSRQFGPWIGYKPESIEFGVPGKSTKIEEVKQVVKYRNKWKIAVIAP